MREKQRLANLKKEGKLPEEQDTKKKDYDQSYLSQFGNMNIDEEEEKQEEAKQDEEAQIGDQAGGKNKKGKKEKGGKKGAQGPGFGQGDASAAADQDDTMVI